MIIPNSKVYDWLKWIAQVLLPAVGALYFGLAGQLDLPNADTVVGCITVIDAFLGAILGFSTVQYNNSDEKYDGQINVIQEAGLKKLELEPFIDPGTFESKDQIVFKMNPINLDLPEGE